jgi:hypothetical protein
MRAGGSSAASPPTATARPRSTVRTVALSAGARYANDTQRPQLLGFCARLGTSRH